MFKECEHVERRNGKLSSVGEGKGEQKRMEREVAGGWKVAAAANKTTLTSQQRKPVDDHSPMKKCHANQCGSQANVR
ncbi:hypothetical protein Q1695_003924 [Nippostrongylus brasiliensis]|nr:hypothetical protein Q1695_003924 [Nippostrongylus brasiliensis]